MFDLKQKLISELISESELISGPCAHKYYGFIKSCVAITNKEQVVSKDKLGEGSGITWTCADLKTS